MKQTSCNYCGRDDFEQVIASRDLYLNRSAVYHLVRCRHCGLIYQNPQLEADELLPHYPPSEYALYSRAIEEESSALHRADRQRGMMRRYHHLMKYVDEPGRMLDIGCATGAFIAAMRDQQWQVVGVELNPQAAEYARRTLHLDVRTGVLEDARFSDDEFDVVTMWDVFEHVLNPRETLREIARILKPGGWLVTAVPNPASLEARLFGRYWAGWDQPRHLHLYAPDVLRRYLQDAGFEQIKIDSFSGRLNVTLLSTGYLCNAKNIPEKRWKPWLNALYNWPLRLLTWPMYRLAEAFNQTTNMTVFARLSAPPTQPHA